MSGEVAAGTLRRTALYEEHVRLGARMVPFAGWEMPLQYTGIVEEHHAVRRRAGMFDVSHMGRFEVQGPQAAQILRYVCTYDVTRLSLGEGHYAVVCQPDGGIIDDVYVFCLTPQRFLLVANAANAERIRDWLKEYIGGFEARLVDRHLSTVMVAVQGPRAVETCSQALASALGEVAKRRCVEVEWEGDTLFASRTGYTGEDGFELVVTAEAGPKLWRRLLDAGVQPCGLGARDTLRLEAALLLYGNDMDTSVDPFEVGLAWVVTLDGAADFIGRKALMRAKEAGPQRVLACLKAEGRGIMRPGCAILHRVRQVGKVTSGGFSPTLGVSVGMGFLPPELAVEGTELVVDVRGKPLSVRVVPRPFYKPSRSG